MIPAWLSKAVMPVLFAAAVLLLAAILSLKAVSAFDDMVEKFRTRVVAGRDAYWASEIQQVELEKAEAEIAHLKRVNAIQADAEEKTRAAEQALSELEKQNAALPNGADTGLSRDRVRLLPN